ncbi:MAG: adenosylmethionine--8-amino-7-oxononanoate transaminase [Myxococcaceae bacterium]|nr:adenosylmethionine--8-amino-7-oxononanoate transaminase [Myxococcaceae bacterium]
MTAVHPERSPKGGVEGRTSELLQLDLKHVWHPFTQHQSWPDDEPIIIERAEANWLIDTDGRRYLDGVSSLWCNVHGHQKRELDAAITAQLGQVAHSTMLGLANVPAIRLAAKLSALAPEGLTKVFYSDSGSTAVEVALKMAYQYQQLAGRPQKRKLAALVDAYHGDTLGSVSVGGMSLFHARFRDLVFPVVRVPVSLAAVERLFAEQAHELAAFIVEPLIQGAAGMLLQPPGWLKAVEALCRKHDVLLVCDEVATGFGRTGTMFAVEHESVKPDLLCVAKGLTGGYLPLAATLATQRIFEAFLGSAAEQKTFFHGHTYTGNPLACAVALASLELFEREQTLERMKPAIEALARGLEPIACLKNVAEVRRRGFMVGIELKGYVASDRTGFKVCKAARKHGVLLRPLGDVVVLMPPLSLTVEEARLLTRTVYECITSL